MKSEHYMGYEIEFYKQHRFRTSYGYAGNNDVYAYVDDELVAVGKTKADALKEAKKVIRHWIE